MGDNKSIINLGGISKPATVLIEKISDAIGGYFKPYQIKRVAKAEAEADKIKAISQIEITELQHRALRRFVAEEAKKQQNIESITAKALPHLDEQAKPQDMDEDWIANFFDKCRLVSNEEMQTLWSRVLAGEANAPGTYSKRTVDFMGSLDRRDAELFTTLCGYGWFFGDVIPLVYDTQAKIYMDKGITFGSLKHLDAIGLISFESVAGYRRTKSPKQITVFYYGTPIKVEFQKDAENDLDLGHVLLTKTGRELAPICGSQSILGFLDYVIENWKSKGHVVSSPASAANEESAEQSAPPNTAPPRR